MATHIGVLPTTSIESNDTDTKKATSTSHRIVVSIATVLGVVLVLLLVIAVFLFRTLKKIRENKNQHEDSVSGISSNTIHAMIELTSEDITQEHDKGTKVENV